MLQGTDHLTVPSNHVLKFTYPASGDDPLYIHSGANAINWSYVLNTQSTPTIGGEVVQVLSCFVGPLTIQGQTAGLRTNQSGKLTKNQIPGWKQFNGRDNFSPNHELREIVQWFRKYMTRAGSDNLGNVYRSERAIKFEYPERGWVFYIMPTGLKGFKYDKGVVSPEWSITAEIVSNNALDYFAGVTMTSFTDELLTTNAKLQGQIGLSYFQTTGTQNANPNFGQTGDYGSTNPFLNPELYLSANKVLKKMGDNFQGLVAAWSTGDFAHFGFGALLDNNELPKNVDAVYQKIFGNTFLGSLAGNSSGSGGGNSGGGSYTYTGSNKQDAAAAAIANAFQAKGVPPELGVAVALHESSLNPDQTQYGCNLPACGIGLFQVNGDGSGEVGSHKAQIIKAGNQRKYGSANGNIVGVYTLDMQVQDAAEFFKANQPGDITGNTDNLSNDRLAEWAYAAERGSGYLTNTSSGSCTPEFASKISDAKALLKGLSQTGSGGGDVVSLAKAGLNFAGKMVYTEGSGRSELFHRSKGDFKGAGADCSQFVSSILHWCGNTKVTDSDYTGTLLQKGKLVSSPQPGDVVVWGPGTGVHTAFITEASGGDWYTIGFGGQGAPDKVLLSAMDQYFSSAGNGGHRFLRF